MPSQKMFVLTPKRCANWIVLSTGVSNAWAMDASLCGMKMGRPFRRLHTDTDWLAPSLQARTASCTACTALIGSTIRMVAIRLAHAAYAMSL